MMLGTNDSLGQQKINGQGANMLGANMLDANMQGANIQGANIQGESGQSQNWQGATPSSTPMAARIESDPEAHLYEKRGIGILGLGAYMPEKVITNKDLEKIVDTSDEWIVQRTGISERRIIAEGETTTNIAVLAAKAALADAGVGGGAIGLVVVATATPDYFAPATASAVQHAIGAGACAAYDLNAGCTGSLYALVMAHSYISAGICDYALVVGAETLSRSVDWHDRKTCILFGDGAGAAVLGRTVDDKGFISSLLRSDGEESDIITIPALSATDVDLERRGGEKKSTVWLDGSKVMKYATRAMYTAVSGVVGRAGLGMGDIKLVVPHQANIRIIDYAAKRLGLDDGKVFVNIGKYGNTSAASILIALIEARNTGQVTDGDYIVMVSFGAGLTYGAALMRWQGH